MTSPLLRAGVAGLAFCAVMAGVQVVDARPRCSLDSGTGMSFGTYRPHSDRPLDSVAFLTFSCQDTAADDTVMIQLSRSRGGGFMPRLFDGPSPSFEYNIYLDAGRTVVWGDGTAGTTEYHGQAPEGRTVQIPVYGRVAPHQSPRPGEYRDTVVVTMFF